MVIEPCADGDGSQTILWRGISWPGHEACRLFCLNSGWHLEGSAVFSYEKAPCRLDYRIACDPAWRTHSARVNGWVGHTLVSVYIETDSTFRWRMDDVEQPGVEGCSDVDLNFSPSTNLLPIRRLNLKVGESAGVKAAWLRFPSFQLETLVQEYRRLDETTYRYTSGGGKFTADLKVDPSGLVIDYPGLWLAEVGG